jgi:hypothetical protein
MNIPARISRQSTSRLIHATFAAALLTLTPTAARADGVPTWQPFFTRPDSQFVIARTYYVAANEPGASNSNNGLYPTYLGGKNGPFRDLNDVKVRALLQGSDGVRMVIRQGVYKLAEINEGGVDLPGGGTGLTLVGSGDEYHPIILTGYPGESAVLDGGERLPWDFLLKLGQGQASYNVGIRQVVTLAGRYTIVQNLTIRDGFRHNVQATGVYAVVRNNTLIGAYEDSIKIVAGADYGLIQKNDISGFVSQAVDHFGGNQWIIDGNDMHHPGPDPVTNDVEANAIGTKGGVTGVLVTNNRIHDFNTNLVPAIVLGGTGNLEPFKKDAQGKLLHSAAEMTVRGNLIYNYRGPATNVLSCRNCTIEGNTVYSSLALSMLGVTEDQYQSEWVKGLPPSANVVIRNNAFAGNIGSPTGVCASRATIKVGTTCYVNYIPTAREVSQGFLSDGNTYYMDTQPLFVYPVGGKMQNRTLSQFQSDFRTDYSSSTWPPSYFQFPPQ